eukprot:3939963-Rhodomonas_salina.2
MRHDETPFASSALEGNGYIDATDAGTATLAQRPYIGARFQAWRWHTARGGSECPERLDEEEGVVGDGDEAPPRAPLERVTFEE